MDIYKNISPSVFSSIKHASIIFGNVIVEGNFDSIFIIPNTNIAKIKIDGKDYVTSMTNILLEEECDDNNWLESE